MSRDWRVSVLVVSARTDPSAVERDIARGLGGRFVVSREGRTFYAYAETEREAHAAAAAIQALLSEKGAPAYPSVDIWNPRELNWQDASLPVEPPEAQPSLTVDLDTVGWQVKLRTPSYGAAVALARVLEREGFVASLGWPILGWRAQLVIPIHGREEAEALEQRLRFEAPAGSRVRIEPVTRLRRWLLKQAIVGNYETTRRTYY